MAISNDKVSHKVGDAIERAGEKVSDMGAPKVGQKISNAGDKLEHSQDDEIAQRPLKKDY